MSSLVSDYRITGYCRICGWILKVVIKLFFMLNSVEHEIFSANAFSDLLAEKIFMLSFISKIEIGNNLKFISRTNFMLSRVEHEKSLYNLGATRTDVQTGLDLRYLYTIVRAFSSWSSPKVVNFFHAKLS